jgi:hypothetical protein
MSLIQKQLLIWLVSALLIALPAFCYGESARNPFGGVYLVMILSMPAIIILMFVLNLMIKQKWFIHFFVGLAFFVLLAVAFSYGSSSSQNAFNDCVENGEKVRMALAYYYQKNQRYPNKLAELNIDLPGKRIMLPNILQYETTDTGYLLYFDDNFIRFEATESAQFEANK